MRKIGVVTVARSDYGIYFPILRKLRQDCEVDLSLLVSGMHLSPEFGCTVRELERDGFSIGDRIEMLLSSDTPEGIGKSLGLGVIGFSQSFARCRPDILLVLGDRFEMLSAVLAAMPFTIPVAHIHGGEATQGLIDESIRHSITKMSHIHFASTDTYRHRIIQMGEQPDRVFTTGAPSLDNVSTFEPLPREELESTVGMDLSSAPLLVTFHPVTLEYEKTGFYIEELIDALNEHEIPKIFTYPNADTAGRLIISRIDSFVRKNRNCCVVKNLGTRAYFSLMKLAVAMVGNSSSGIIEAASFELPVVNVGNRQRGRVRGKNVIDCKCQKVEISRAIEQASSDEFRESLARMKNPYGDGQASSRIVQILKNITLSDRYVVKPFFDMRAGFEVGR